eukprot:CAMPEP_0115839516 /NCGR_PEP_ID=MMETSP0287-20121206/6294_1 /TAXON_ID=412157 /ORGANISM="Chrysochromulina rotalis, Strain UIO044" /LENGTH=68 /DNA_ID=CAMNT_0003293095 /DNA_START=90 /DNA_END=296 /DNA_ORIENTATION=-
MIPEVAIHPVVDHLLSSVDVGVAIDMIWRSRKHYMWTRDGVPSATRLALRASVALGLGARFRRACIIR